MNSYLEILRYGAAGLVNTVVGYAMFWVMLRLVGISAALSNAAGYAVGLIVSYALNKKYVFLSSRPKKNAPIIFAGSFLVAFSINQVVLFYSVHSFDISPEIGQIMGMSVYTGVFYLLNKFAVYERRNGQVRSGLGNGGQNL